jgi:type IV pilus assembly protein PilV
VLSGAASEWLQWRRASGFSLVEAMVALVIMSVGLLGVGQLMLVGLRTGGSALARTQAVHLIGDMMERIRANPAARRAYDCSTYAPAPTERGCAPSGAPAVQCSASQLAEDDLARWQQQARQVLPLPGSGSCNANVRYLANADEPGVARYEVELTWHERGQDAPSSLTGVLLIASDVRA